ncbi:MAG: hypothetical protein HRT89_19975, partial [Lentisphaeria bacterium]|nr:hypothetical protein [Lentisphaeria bacterium]
MNAQSINNLFKLEDKYTLQEGQIILSGLQALVRLPLDQGAADKRNNLTTAGFISGYRGSPLGGLDTLLHNQKHLLDEHDIRFMPGINEDLAATAVYGTQMADFFPDAKYDGVFSMWYGKGPGVDRSCDVFRHGNFAGSSRKGGVLAVAGDDGLSKSSTLPSAIEAAFYYLWMPLFHAGNVQEILDYGRYGIELSRYCGLWSALKVTTNVCDSFCTAEVSVERLNILKPDFEINNEVWTPSQNILLLPPYSLELEHEIIYERLEAAKYFAEQNKINQIFSHGDRDKIGIVSTGTSWYCMMEAFASIGIGEKDLAEAGIRLMKLGMVYPLPDNQIKEFSKGLERILVIEEKRSFIELFIREILYNETVRPVVIGKNDESGDRLVPADGELDADLIVKIFARVFQFKNDKISERIKQIDEAQSIVLEKSIVRQPYFCSGCPHNKSTQVVEGSIAGGGIGCHALAIYMERSNFGITHMGGEGVQW